MYSSHGVGEDSWESLGLQGDTTSPSERKSVLNVHWKDWCWSWNSNTLATWCEELTHWKRPWCWEGLGAGGGTSTQSWNHGSLPPPLKGFPPAWTCFLRLSSLPTQSLASLSWRWAGLVQGGGCQRVRSFGCAIPSSFCFLVCFAGSGHSAFLGPTVNQMGEADPKVQRLEELVLLNSSCWQQQLGCLSSWGHLLILCGKEVLLKLEHLITKKDVCTDCNKKLASLPQTTLRMQIALQVWIWASQLANHSTPVHTAPPRGFHASYKHCYSQGRVNKVGTQWHRQLAPLWARAIKSQMNSEKVLREALAPDSQNQQPHRKHLYFPAD